MTRYCPNCGAVVPEGSLNCPQCYKEIPRSGAFTEKDRKGRTQEEYKREIGERRKSMKMSLALAIVPAFFGILGLGQIYQDRRDGRGWGFLAIGLLLFLATVGLVYVAGGEGLFTTILLAIPIIIAAGLYLCTAIVSVGCTYLGSFRMFGVKV